MENKESMLQKTKSQSSLLDKESRVAKHSSFKQKIEMLRKTSSKSSQKQLLPVNNVPQHRGSFKERLSFIRQSQQLTPKISQKLVPEQNSDDTNDELNELSLTSDPMKNFVDDGQNTTMLAHLLKQLRPGMDLTTIRLPTYILEPHSLLEMFSDFVGYANLWSNITNGTTPKDRLIAVVKWYLSSFVAARSEYVAKKPYNPIIGEIFRCCWKVDSNNKSSAPIAADEKGPTPWTNPSETVSFIAEQVSHHPPVSAFYVEHQGRQMSMDGHIWTRSKFLGLSIGIDMVGKAIITLLQHNEQYHITFPSAYARSIYSFPWFELVGKPTITCPESGYKANIEFKAKPMISNKRDQVNGDCFGPDSKQPFLTIKGNWKSTIHSTSNEGKTVLFDKASSNVDPKIVRNRTKQEKNESRRLWLEVTNALRKNDIDTANKGKLLLEKNQVEVLTELKNKNIPWEPKYFEKVTDNTWKFKSLLADRLQETQSNMPSISIRNHSSIDLDK